MILLLITMILLVLKYFGIINWSYWFVCLPVLVEAAFSTYLFVKAEIVYLRDYKKERKEETKE